MEQVDKIIEQIKTDESFLKKYKDLIIILLVLLLFLGNVWSWNKIHNQEQSFNRYESAISAINDSLHVIIHKGKKEYVQKTPEIDIKTLINSEYFKTLSQQQQQFYKDLNNIKGLISATNAQLEKHGRLLDQLSIKDSHGQLKEDSISFALGTPLSFKEQDTSKKMQWKAGINIDNPISFKLDYTYKFDITTTFQRQKDKSITVNYMLNDSALKVNKMQNFIIPQEQKKTALGRWIEKNKKPLSITGAVILFFTGGYVGYKLAK
jgi:hypothetical protein